MSPLPPSDQGGRDAPCTPPGERTRARLERIAREIGTPVEAFFGSDTPSGDGARAPSGAPDRELLHRLLVAYHALPTRDLRLSAVDLLEGLPGPSAPAPARDGSANGEG